MLEEDHRPAGLHQLGGGDQAADAAPDDDRTIKSLQKTDAALLAFYEFFGLVRREK